MVNMDREVDHLFTGTCITIIVCAVSTILYYMFKYTVFTPTRSVAALLDSSKKKTKKPDSKKTKKPKKQKHMAESIDVLDHDPDRAQTSEETIDEEESLSVDESERHIVEDKQVNIPCNDESNDHVHASKQTPDPAARTAITTPPGGDFGEEHTHGIDERPISSAQLLTAAAPFSCSSQTKPFEESNFTQIPELTSGTSFEVISSQTAVESNPKSNPTSKRSKKRSAKRIESLKSATDTASNPVLNMPNVEHMVDAFEEVTKSGSSKPAREERRLGRTITDAATALGESQEELGKITEQLRASERKLEEVAKQASHLSEENERLRAKEEEHSLALHVVQNQYRELLRSSKVIEHEKNLKEAKLKGLENERDTLRTRLEQANAETGRVRTEAEREMRELRDQLTEGQAKLAAAMNAVSSPPPGPSPELIRAQELTQAMSKENCLLQSRLEQLEAELGQLRQANVIQQQELQAFRVETHKLRAEKETALEELRNKRQTDQTEANSRIASYETQFQRQLHELELERKRTQELMVKLTESRNELSRYMDREKQQSEIISSLEYQFAELNAQKQRLFEEATNSKALNESAVNELRAQVISLTSDLMHAKAELQAVQLRADNLTNELQSARADAASSKSPQGSVERTDASVGTDVVMERSAQLDDVQISASAAPQQQSGSAARESTQIVEQLRHQLASVKEDYLNATRDLDEARQHQKAITMKLERYKTTLVETESLLAKLQDFAGEAEQKWRLLLADSEAERVRLAKRLAEAHDKTAETTRKLKEAERKLAKQITTREETTHAKDQPTGGSKKSGRKHTSKHEQRHPTNSETTSTSCAADTACSAPSVPQLDVITSTVVVSPACTDEPVVSVSALHDAIAAELPVNQHPDVNQPDHEGRNRANSEHPQKKQLAAEPPVALECQEVEGTWIALSSSSCSSSREPDHGAHLGSDGLLHVSARAVSGSRWTSSVHELKTSQLLPGDMDTDYDFDAVLVDDTDLHVPDDIWDSDTKYSENVPADSHCDAQPLSADHSEASVIKQAGDEAGASLVS